MKDYLERTEKLYGTAALEQLAASHVAVFGLGGVGGYAAEALVRSGIGSLDLIDADCFVLSNLNRQLHATRNSLGRRKVDVVAERCLSIDPDCRIQTYPLFFDDETSSLFDFRNYDHVVDAIDSVRSKLLLIRLCHDAGVPLISSMGTGGKTDPLQLRVSDLFETSVDPLARVMRRECRKMGVERLPVVWSAEEPKAPMPASSAFVPPAAGLLLASRVVTALCAPKVT